MFYSEEAMHNTMKKRRTIRGILKNPARQIIFTKPGPIISFFRSFGIFWEFFSGFLFIANFAKAASFFGSAREQLPDEYYLQCEDLAARLSRKGFAIITGGAGGIMRSANKGAWRAEGDSVGINILLPHEQNQNKFIHFGKDFKYFFSRKTILSCASEVYIFFPGGFGTLDELFEMLTIIQTRYEDTGVPVILYGEEFWKPLVQFIEKHLIEKYKTVSSEDRNFFVVVDSVDEAERYIDSLNIRQSRVCKLKAS